MNVLPKPFAIISLIQNRRREITRSTLYMKIISVLLELVLPVAEIPRLRELNEMIQLTMALGGVAQLTLEDIVELLPNGEACQARIVSQPTEDAP
ncbi:hypothetical protein C5E08_00900 [Rathayibacter iranicus]|nr:hypothetical protein C5E09_00900 [Rathayibacter iranicus]PPI63374.1 hypothetical protein C5E08_00900 [Rathayibacter iranicus]PPI74084.1 hypothetical protein C5E01_00880 [Rathayibacter iranicus]